MTVHKTGQQGLTPQQQFELRKKNQSQNTGKTETSGGAKTEPKETGKTQGGVKTQSTPSPKKTEVQTTFTSVPQETVSKKESGTSTMDKVSQQVSKSGVERPDPQQRKGLRRNNSKTQVGESQTQVEPQQTQKTKGKTQVEPQQTPKTQVEPEQTPKTQVEPEQTPKTTGKTQVEPQQTPKQTGKTEVQPQQTGSTTTGQTRGTSPTLTIPTSGTMDSKPVFDSLKTDYPHLSGHIDSMLKQKVGIDVIRTNSGTSAYYDQPSNSIKVQNDGTLDTPKLKDNVLYESFNAWANTEYKRLDKELSSRNINVSQYGEQKGRVEAQVTIKYVDSILEGFKGNDKVGDRAKLVELARQVPPNLEAQGARQLQDRLNVEAQKLGLTEKALRAMGWAERIAPGYVANPRPSEHKKLEDDFLAQPHQANPEKPRFGLSSKDLYTYEGIERQTAGGLIGMLQGPLKGMSTTEVTQVRNRISGMRTELEKLDKLPETNDTEKDVKAKAKCKAYQDTLQGIIKDYPNLKSKFEPQLLSTGIKSFAGIT